MMARTHFLLTRLLFSRSEAKRSSGIAQMAVWRDELSSSSLLSDKFVCTCSSVRVGRRVAALSQDHMQRSM